MNEGQKLPPILMIMLCLDCGLGGAEKRYTRMFKMLIAQSGAQHKLLVNRSMFELLQVAEILSDIDRPHIIVLDPPFQQFMRSSKSKKISRMTGSIGDILNIFWYIWQCWRVIYRLKPKIVHPLLTSMYLSLPSLLVSPNTSYIMSAYATYFKPDNYTHSNIGVKIAFALKRFAMQRSHAIDALKSSIYEELVELGLDKAKIFTSPCSFTDISLCEPVYPKKRWVVFLGRFIDHKDPLLLARAIPLIIPHIPDVHFFFLGKGHLQPKLKSLIQEFNLSEYVTIKFDPHPTHILNQSSIFASMQTRDNYPSQSLLEAMACGNAIVATDTAETWRLVDESNGIRVAPNEQAVAKAIIKLLGDPNLEKLGQTSRQRILTEHTPQRFYDYLTHVYKDVNNRLK